MQRSRAVLCLFVNLIVSLTINTKSFSQSKSKTFEQVKVLGDKSDFLEIKEIYGDSYSKQFFKDYNLQHAEEALKLSPNVNFSGGSNRIRYIQIRGIGERSEYDSVPKASVGSYYDHIDLSGIGGISSSFDTKKLEILKGSQSYLYGDSSIAGNVLIESSQPDQHKKDFNLRLGSQNQKALNAQINIPVTESISLKFGGEKNQSDGFYNNTYLNKHTSNRDETFLNFGSTIYIEKIKLESRHIFANFKNGYDVWNAYINDFTTFTDQPGRDNQKALGHSLQVSVPLGKHHLELISSHLKSDSLYSYDEDWGNNGFWNALPGYSDDYSYFKSYDRKNTNKHLKALYQIKHGRNTFNLGLHLYSRSTISDIKSFKDSSLRSSLQSDYTSKHQALFTSYKLQFNKKISLNLGGRLERQKIKYSDSKNFNDTISSSLSSQNFELLYKYNQKNSLKLILSTGFSGSGINPDLNLTASQQTYGPETATNYETSWTRKSSWFDHKVNLFYTKRNNQQIATSTQNNPLDPSEFTIYTDNASKSENYGLEFTGVVAPLSPLNLGFSLGLLKAKFISYEREGVSYDDRDLAHAPNYHISTFINYSVSDIIKLTLSSLSKDSFYYSNSHNQKSKSYSIYNANLSFKISNHLSISTWVKNLLNKNYSIRGFYFPNRPPNWESELYTQQGAPREWGLQLSSSF